VTMIFRYSLAVLALIAGTPSAKAQRADQPLVTLDTAPPSAEALSLAKIFVAKTTNGDIASYNFLALPMSKLMHEMGVSGPDQSKAILREAIVPVLAKHSDELTDIQAKTAASVLSVDDLKAALAFYATPAGAHYLQVQQPLRQLNLAALSQLFETLRPEFEAKTAEVMKAHGWVKG
jgi:hypothetical protein